MLWINIKKHLIDLLFPIFCVGCGKEGYFICPDCLKEIPINLKIQKIRYIHKLIITSTYTNPIIKKAIHEYKYNFVKELCIPLAELMIERLKAVITDDLIEKILLVPVPLHKRRLRERGFNQAELLAKQISKAIGIPINTNLLIRKHYSLPQVKIKDAQLRRKNIRKAFELNSKFQVSSFRFHDKIIILIDDVCTTGATLKECAKVLEQLKPNQIWALVLARG